MTFTAWMKAFSLWIFILMLAVLNGALREEVLMPVMGSFAGFMVSGILLSGCIFMVAFLASPWYGRLSSRQWLIVGFFWLLITLVFEFGFGRFVERKVWSELLQAYTFKGGNLWPLVLAAAFLSPWLAARWRQRPGRVP